MLIMAKSKYIVIFLTDSFFISVMINPIIDAMELSNPNISIVPLRDYAQAPHIGQEVGG